MAVMMAAWAVMVASAEVAASAAVVVATAGATAEVVEKAVVAQRVVGRAARAASPGHRRSIQCSRKRGCSRYTHRSIRESRRNSRKSCFRRSLGTCSRPPVAGPCRPAVVPAKVAVAMVVAVPGAAGAGTVAVEMAAEMAAGTLASRRSRSQCSHSRSQAPPPLRRSAR